MNKQEILQKCTVDGMVVRLPEGQLERKLYNEVAQALQLIGGKWVGRKVMGFVFQEDPTELLAQIAGGEKRNLKKEFQFFATPDGLAERVAKLACIGEKDTICEPSAGSGAMVNAILKLYGSDKKVSGYELMPLNQGRLSKIPQFELLGSDFLTCTQTFDRIVANPPFAKNQDIDHIYKMYDCLNPGGRMSVICSKHYQFGPERKAQEFKKWIHGMDVYTEDVPAGTFKESGTTIETVILVIDKQHN